MSRLPLRHVLQSVLLLGAPLALSDCGFSSCPDNGYEPPLSKAVAVEASLANGGPLDATQCDNVCNGVGESVVTCVRESAESVLCFARPFPCEGRRPAGLTRSPASARGAFAAHLADAAWLEAASIEAFRLLRRELRSHGAPRRLLRAASRSARDERRHARIAKALAQRFGATVAPVEREVGEPRGVEALALENAVEGCVRETWGALMALRQATQASEPSVRAAMGRIARDEIRHAELAWKIDAWLRPRLTEPQQKRVRDARAAAVAGLAADATWPLPYTERQRLGLPSTREASHLLAELDRSLGLSSQPRA